MISSYSKCHCSRAAAFLGTIPWNRLPASSQIFQGSCVTSQGQLSVLAALPCPGWSRSLQQVPSHPDFLRRVCQEVLSASYSCVRALLPPFLLAGKGGTLRSCVGQWGWAEEELPKGISSGSSCQLSPGHPTPPTTARAASAGLGETLPSQWKPTGVAPDNATPLVVVF